MAAASDAGVHDLHALRHCRHGLTTASDRHGEAHESQFSDFHA
ncbi:hypothetical protein MYA_5178 [Burkholderia sp. KJ006]|nr:hypothetical protein MYA_5178 [Burkholderia sp. KJ006]